VVVQAGSSYVDELIRARVQKELQEALEAERDEIVGRAWYKHHAEGLDKHYRNGYADPRLLSKRMWDCASPGAPPATEV